MTKEEQLERLTYWLAAYQCRMMTMEQISEKLDQIILALGEETPGVFIDLAWEIGKGEEGFFHAMDEALWTFKRDWKAPISPKLYWTLRLEMRKKWEAGEWSMEETVDHLYFLSKICEGIDGEILSLCDIYDEVIEGTYGTVEQLTKEFLEVIHREPEERL